MRRLLILLIVCALAVPVLAQQAAPDDTTDQYPTLTTLRETRVPPANSTEIAMALFGIPAPPETILLPPLAVGQAETFSVSGDAGAFLVDAVLRAVGEHIYVWVEADTGVPDNEINRLVTNFDDTIYAQVRELWGEEANPGIDGDSRVHVLFADNLGAFVGAYYARRHSFPNEVFPNSNQREMFFVNLDAFGTGVSASSAALAHEFQHMIRANVDLNEDTWLDEGFSTFTEVYLGYPNSTVWLPTSFLNAPGTQLNTFGLSEEPRAVNYGAGFLFTNYFYDRFGLEGVQQLSADPANGLLAVDNVTRALAGSSADEFFADWVATNYIQTGDYAYTTLQLMQKPLVRGMTDSYPFTSGGQLAQYATDYYLLGDVDDTLEITLDLPSEVRLIPTDAYGGERLWYSNRGDVTHTTLTRAFDLTGVGSATLSYHTWYAIEEDWDYVYLTVSADGGATWDILAAPGTTTSNPHGNAYGPGYSGYSGVWVPQAVSLDAYVGQTIQVRFELVTDDAVNEPGFALDDVAISEIDYFADFETDDGGWQSDGWLWMDNRLPQQAWVQVFEYDGDEFLGLTRWQATGGVETWSLPLKAATDEAVIAVSPFAPLTTVPTDYTLTVR
jgi:immune inhibitor A